MVPLVGHGTIRIAVLGFENRAPTESELAEMKRLTADAMQAGAFGLSSGLIYVPANYADTEEIIELAKVAGRYRGIYTTHMRSEGDREMEAIDETLRIAVRGRYRRAYIPPQDRRQKQLGQEHRYA